MSELLRTSEPTPAPSPPLRPRPRILVAGAGHPRRADLERFIEARFERAFGACGLRHYPLVSGLCDVDGAVLAAAGVRFAETEPLFLERYLDAPVEQLVADSFGRPVARAMIAEVGSLAAATPAAALQLFRALAPWLGSACGRRFAVATARPELQKLLSRAGFGLQPLAEADPARLGDGAGDWGRYYTRGPRVFAGEIAVSPALPLLRQRLREKTTARAIRRLRATAP